VGRFQVGSKLWTVNGQRGMSSWWVEESGKDEDEEEDRAATKK
jgi:hypothetical protein